MYRIYLTVGLLTLLFIEGAASAYADLSSKYLQVSIQTTSLTNFLAMPKSTVSPVVRADVSVKGMNGDITPPALYKSIWYGNGVCIGSQRRTQLPVDASEPIEIHVREINQDLRKADAATGAVLRIYLEAQLKNAFAGTVYVTPESFDTVRDALARQSFVPYNQANGTIGAANITLVAEDRSQQLALTYTPQAR